MLLLRRLTPLMRLNSTTRIYSEKVTAAATNKLRNTLATNKLTTHNMQVHQEMMRHVHPQASFRITTDILLHVRSASVHDFPAGDAFVAQLYGGPAKNCGASMEIKVSDDDQRVDVVLAKVAGAQTPSDFYCELALPIRANLHIDSKDSVSVANMYGGDELEVRAQKDIKTKELRTGKITLSSAGGHIQCDGLLLGKDTTIETQQQGNVHLNKLQGDKLSCKTQKGNITTNSCYVESSKFETDTGCLQLKNVHKKSEVYIYEKGDLNMTGVHGNIYVHTNGGTMQLQLSELEGENIIIADKIELAAINISDAIEENSYIEMSSTAAITLDSSLSHLSDCLSDDNQMFRMSVERDNHNKLLVSTKGGVKLGKLSWADSVRASLGAASGGEK